jgi:hypothetical protein
MPEAPKPAIAPAATDDKSDLAKRRKIGPVTPTKKRVCPDCHEAFAIRGGSHFRSCKFKALVFTEKNVAPFFSFDTEFPVFASNHLDAGEV